MPRTKFLPLTVTIIVSFAAASQSVLASDFTTDYNVNYTIDEQGNARVEHQITLTNQTTDRYVSDYTLTASQPQIVEIQASDDSGSLETQSEQREGTYTIKIFLGERTAGFNSRTPWTISYKIPKLAVKKGLVWEINVPRVEHSTPINSFKLNLVVPSIFSSPQFIIPRPTETSLLDNEYQSLSFDGQSGIVVTEEGLQVAFGSLQLFNFELIYHLENPLDLAAQTEIALLPDLKPYQKIYLSKLFPQPQEIYRDQDGNFLARYLLKPQEKLNVIYRGQAQISAAQGWVQYQEPDSSHQLLHANYTLPAKYWEANDKTIASVINEQLDPGMTASEKALKLYHYTLEQLEYDNSRFNEEVQRLGAIEALNQKDRAVCMEFTDLLITLLRAADIPARELDGYAYSPTLENENEGDVLHSWVQFYDSENSHWRFIDPTWEDTSGRDYFNYLDTDRIVFVIKGIDSEKPYPAGSYKLDANKNDSEDIKINFAEKRLSGAIPFTLWKQNLLSAKQQSSFIDSIFGWIVKLLDRI